MADKRLKLKKGVLSVEGMHFYSYHGCSPEETLIGADYFVDVKIKSDYSSSIKEDELKNTFDYTTIYNLVKAEMNIPSKLIEHVAGRIANSLQ